MSTMTATGWAVFVVEIEALQKLLAEREAERDAEVAELKVALESVSDHGSGVERMGFIRRQGAEIAGQRELLRRAGEALECCNLDHLQDNLIAEVRQAAGGEKER